MPNLCPACSKPMSAVAARCPHCGAGRAGDEPSGSGKPLAPPPRIIESSEEAAALLAVHSATEHEGSFWRDYLWPHPSLHGIWPLVDFILIIATLPILSGIVLTLFYAPSHREEPTASGLYTENVLVGFLGGAVLIMAGLAENFLAPALTLAVIGMVALVARVTIRLAHMRHHDMW